MAIWLLKAAIQKTISFLPFRHNINFFFQKYITKGVRLTDALFSSKLHHCQQHFTAHTVHGNKKPSFTSLEIGTGWFPIVPIGLYLCGAEKIYSADIKSVLNKERLMETINKFIEYHNNGSLVKFLPAYQSDKINNISALLVENKNLNELLAQLNIELLIGDITKIDIQQLPKIDLINSNNTFEHIPPQVINAILQYFHKIIIADGVMSHFIDMSDHFAHLDKSISAYNFLKFSKTQWKLIDNSIQPQNRLRICDYTTLLKNAQFKVVFEEPLIDSAITIDKVNLNRDFKHNYTNDCLSATHVLLVAKTK